MRRNGESRIIYARWRDGGGGAARRGDKFKKPAGSNNRGVRGLKGVTLLVPAITLPRNDVIKSYDVRLSTLYDRSAAGPLLPARRLRHAYIMLC